MSMDHTQLPSEMTFQCVVFFVDISGFTALCETYSNAGKTGTDQLINTLNGYIGAIVAEILAYDGDILKFAGDAILVVWWVTLDLFARTCMTFTFINFIRSFYVSDNFKYWSFAIVKHLSNFDVNQLNL